jgi:ribonuclease P protein component
MKKLYRVKKNEEFQRILNRRKFFTCPSLALYVKERSETTGNARIGISVSKKLGNAVVRNKIKRQIRMMCQEIFDFSEKFDSIILVRQGFLKADYHANKKELENLVKKVKM